MFFGTTEGFFKKNENSQTRKVITEKYKPQMSFTAGTLVYDSHVVSGTTTMNFFIEFIR
jgi:hypothetical protein